ncbi:hypothetical protein PR202_gb11217 [Eleusine coracana subsp. coracana]|uniref:Uncharacterized protein n=1 Tax=Eleusine coracana subsp. coracana TaxID=191504 RepID=A0AAV5EMH8_ELECO|nr:hypothetical protein PR202_gb11217 [Eleusine coracana subsp. coracana]
MAAGVAAALGARTARSCDGCMRRRARWHCPADDAFLCQACDAAVHSANPLARRHHRVRLPTSSSPSSPPPRGGDDAPAWLHGLKRGPRTPRPKPAGCSSNKHNTQQAASSSSAAVPDLEAEEDSGSGIVGDDDDIDMSEHGLLSLEEDEDLLYRVPEFDPMLAELYNPVAEADEVREQKPPPACLISASSLAETTTSSEFIIASGSGSAEADGGLSAFDVPDMELASFAADMECLLMGGEEGFDDLGFLDEEKPQLMNLGCFGMDHHQFEVTTAAAAPKEQREEKKRKRPEMILKLDYEGVIASWARDGGSSPWFNGERPHLDPGGDSWPDLFTAGIRGGGLVGNVTAVTGGEREARVSRYREKRRTRLFAKKIRYEVRKLNAEKRPRMKGRFVKRTALPPLPRPPQKPTRAQQPPAAGMVLAPHQMGVHGRFRF